MIAPFARPRWRAVAGVAGVVLLTGVVGCTPDSNGPEPKPLAVAPTGTAPTLVAKPVPMKVRVTRVSGKLKKSSRASLERSMAGTIGRYWERAYLGGEYPRSDFSNAFPSFSAGAAQKARRDSAFLTNSVLGASTEAVAPKRKNVSLSVLAPNKTAAGVTARIHLVYVADRGLAPNRRVTVSGRLLLTRKASGGWTIFGYDVARSAGPARRGASR